MECDGGSEHAEAIAVAIDALLCHHLRRINHNHNNHNNNYYNNQKKTKKNIFSIRTKATLVSSKLLEERGFVPVTELAPDMCSHVSSSVEECLTHYATRCAMPSLSQAQDDERSMRMLSPTAKSQALQMVALLGQVVLQQSSLQQQQEEESDTFHDDDGDDDRDNSQPDDYWTRLGKITL